MTDKTEDGGGGSGSGGSGSGGSGDNLVRLGDVQTKGRQPAPLLADVTRELGSEDLLMLQHGRASKPQPIKQIRDAHHRLARLLAQGFKDVEVSQITGFSQSRISILKQDPAFRELLDFYHGHQTEVFADITGRLKDLGADAINELSRRLEEEPETMGNKEITELLKTTFDRAGYGPQSKQQIESVTLTKSQIEHIKGVVDEEQQERNIGSGDNIGGSDSNIGGSEAANDTIIDQ